jgi:UDP-N-acetylmuramate-alanine ligase
VADLKGRGTHARFLADVAAIVAELRAELRPGDVVTVMSNGEFGALHDHLLEALRSRAEAAGGG